MNYLNTDLAIAKSYMLLRNFHMINKQNSDKDDIFTKNKFQNLKKAFRMKIPHQMLLTVA